MIAQQMRSVCRTGRLLVSHVGLYLGDGRFVHAPSTGKTVSVESLSSAFYRDALNRGPVGPDRAPGERQASSSVMINACNCSASPLHALACTRAINGMGIISAGK